MKYIIVTTILVLVLFIQTSGVAVGSNEWLDGVKRCVMIYHEENNETDYYDCMLELDANVHSNDESNG